MDNEKLNEKLLKFAGMAYATNDEPTITRYTITPPPDFTDPIWGIAHCFKWLVPKITKKHRVEIMLGSKGCSVYIYKYAKDFSVAKMVAEQNPLALTLCLAIERLIEAENE